MHANDAHLTWTIDIDHFVDQGLAAGPARDRRPNTSEHLE
jgi:hypothetical protein